MNNFATPSQRNTLQVVISILFFFSGFSALCLQVTWSKILGQVIGIDYVSQVVVVSIFMLGLGVGAWLGGWITRKTRQSLSFFALAEMAIAVFAAYSDTILYAVQPIVGNLSGGSIGTAGLVWDFAIYSAVLLPSIILMGTSLPIVVHSLRLVLPVGEATGRLYTINVVGAVAGCLISGTFLVGAIGIKNVLISVAALNFLIALAFLIILRNGSMLDRETKQIKTEIVGIKKNHFRIFLIALMSGFSAIAIEVLYFRIFTFYFGATSYVFPIILGTYLIHIAIGSSIAAGFLARGIAPLQIIKISLLATAGLVFVPFIIAYPILAYDTLLSGAYGIARFNVDINDGVGALLVCFVLSFIMMVPISALSLAFPGLVAAIQTDESKAGTNVAKIYFTLTIGNFSGSILTGAILVPNFGVLTASFVICGILMSAYFIASQYEKFSADIFTGFKKYATGIVLLGALSATPFFYQSIKFGDAPPLRVSNEYNGSVFAHPQYSSDGQIAGYRLNVGAEAATSYNALDVGFGQPTWPVDAMVVTLGRAPKSALIIGIGTGDTAITLRRYYPDIEITIVELLDTVIREMETHGSPELKDILSASNVHVMDGARFINRMVQSKNPPKYDIIQIGVFHVIAAGAGNLFTKEFVGNAKNLLSSDGVITFNAYAPTVAAIGPEIFPTQWIAARGEGRVADAFYGSKAIDEELPSALIKSFTTVWDGMCEVRLAAGIEDHTALVAPLEGFILTNRESIDEQLKAAGIPPQVNDRVVTESYMYWPISAAAKDPRVWGKMGDYLEMSFLNPAKPTKCFGN